MPPPLRAALVSGWPCAGPERLGKLRKPPTPLPSRWLQARGCRARQRDPQLCGWSVISLWPIQVPTGALSPAQAPRPQRHEEARQGEQAQGSRKSASAANCEPWLKISNYQGSAVENDCILSTKHRLTGSTKEKRPKYRARQFKADVRTPLQLSTIPSATSKLGCLAENFVHPCGQRPLPCSASKVLRPITRCSIDEGRHHTKCRKPTAKSMLGIRGPRSLKHVHPGQILRRSPNVGCHVFDTEPRPCSFNHKQDPPLSKLKS